MPSSMADRIHDADHDAVREIDPRAAGTGWRLEGLDDAELVTDEMRATMDNMRAQVISGKVGADITAVDGCPA